MNPFDDQEQNEQVERLLHWWQYFDLSFADINFNEAASRLGIGRATLARWIRDLRDLVDIYDAPGGKVRLTELEVIREALPHLESAGSRRKALEKVLFSRPPALMPEALERFEEETQNRTVAVLPDIQNPSVRVLLENAFALQKRAEELLEKAREQLQKALIKLEEETREGGTR